MSSIPIVETVTNLILTVMQAGGLPVLFGLMTVESFGIPPLPSEVILPFAGFMVAEGNYTFPEAAVVALLGGLLGSLIAYAVGRWGRHLLVTGPRFLRLDPRHLDAMDRWFERRGEWTVLGGRLLPIVRAYISYPAGAAQMSPSRFSVFTLLGAAPFTVGFLYVGVVLGKNWSRILPFFNIADYAAVALIVGAVIYVALRWRNVIGPGFPPRAPGSRPEPSVPSDSGPR